MQVTNITKRAVELSHPRDTLFNFFPRPVLCRTCDSEITLDSPHDVYYSSGEYRTALDWTCAACGGTNELTQDKTLIQGYREYFPKETFMIDYGPFLAFLIVLAMVMIVTAFVS